MPCQLQSSTPLASAGTPWPADSAIRLCALRVEFREDSMTGTTGNGRMESWFPDSLLIDPLPHDSLYFADHLLFLRNYFRFVSKGRVIFDTMVVFPSGAHSAFRLDYPMWHYNYNIGDEQLNLGLTDLFVHSTWKADSAGVDFTSYDAVIIFHAGVGRDFNIGYDATPFDIPSAYINERDLAGRNLPPGVNRGLILPEGENQQEVLDFGVQLSLNGILVKLFGNWLGLPDLFDTETGRSGVGRWAMMDQGSGNVNALVPALPDAWSRVFMGWDTARIHVPSGTGDTLRVARFDKSSAPRIIKLPVTDTEYFLIENRDADADSLGFVELLDREGRKLRYFSDSSNFEVDSGFRVAVSASHYDFGIPGSGLLIWHIDNELVGREYNNNRVNADPAHRGIDLVEADGPQDIGQEYFFASSGAGSELGIQEDCWYGNNAAHRAANGGNPQVSLTDFSFPSARLYDGAYTGIELSRFSNVDTVMSFVARQIYTAPGFPVELPDTESDWDWRIADLTGDGRSELCLLGSQLTLVDSSGAEIGSIPVSDLDFCPVEGAYDLDLDGRDDLILVGDSAFYVVKYVDSLTLRRSQDFETGTGFVYPARTVRGGLGRLIRVAETQDSLEFWLYDLSFNLVDHFAIEQMRIGRQGLSNVESILSTHFIAAGSQRALCLEVDSSALEVKWEISDASIERFGGVVAEPGRRTVFLQGYGYVEALTGEIVCRVPECDAPREDWDSDGIPDGGGPFGRSNAPREDFSVPDGGIYEIRDLDADGWADVLSYQNSPNIRKDTYSRLSATQHSGFRFDSFPVATQGTFKRVFNWTRDLGFYYVFQYRDQNRAVVAVRRLPVRLAGTQRLPYREESFIYNVGIQRPSVHARSDWLYCWPNPSSDVTYIRITWPNAAEAQAEVFDLSGRRVATLRGASALPGPFELAWPLGGVQSGVYVGRVKVSGGGTSAESRIKIAVVK